jgi:RNA polymerase sigma-70 factor (ECF subfamily)
LEEVRRSVIDRWIRGDKEAFEEIVRCYMTDAYLTALGLVGNEEDARDLSQEAFIKVYEARKSFDPDRPFYPWFYRILKNHCLNFIRRFARKRESLYHKDNPERERFSADEPTPLEQLEARERKALLMAAIDRLSFEHREIVVLKNFRGYSYKEIAEILQIPIGTVMSRLYYARRMLKEIIEDLERKGLPEGGSCLAGRNPSPGEVI